LGASSPPGYDAYLSIITNGIDYIISLW